MTQVGPIYHAFLARVSELMDLDPLPGSEAGDELDDLAAMIAVFETEAFPMTGVR